MDIPTVTKEETLAYYLKPPRPILSGRLTVGAAYHVGQKTRPTEQTINPYVITPEILMKRLRNGDDFQNMVTFSRSDSKANSGELGWLPRGALAPSFDRALRSLTIGEITGPIQVGETIHFIQLLNEQPEGMLAFEDCADSIEKRTRRGRNGNVNGINY